MHNCIPGIYFIADIHTKAKYRIICSDNRKCTDKLMSFDQSESVNGRHFESIAIVFNNLGYRLDNTVTQRMILVNVLCNVHA